MSLLSDFGDLVSRAWEGLTSLGKAVVDVAGPAATTVMGTIGRAVEVVREAWKEAFRSPPATERERIERDLEDVNERIMRLRKRYYERGSLSEGDKRENEHLLRQRAELMKELDALDQMATAEDIVAEEEKYQPLQIDAELTHILQYHVGQGTFNKNCRICSRAMILQYKRERPVAATHDFFWACIGYYDNRRRCLHSEPLTTSDFNLFVNVRRPEFEWAPADLSELVLERSPGRVRTAMRDLIGRLRRTRQGVDGYRCPIHKERLVLREKRSPDGLLDQFFLGCPRYDADGNGCNYLVKIKSPAQISAVFDASGEGGLIQVTESGSVAPIATNHGKPWTDELEAHVARAYEQKLPISQIAAIFQRSETSICLKLQSMGKMNLEEALGKPGESGSALRIKY